ncbi:Folic acid synthesis protein [Mycena sanguinolenta]|uniref:Folic acid synthesis protein n=1 Tax=Mycena sanguinolenta TaxID=230812 RepID=A0A8H6YST7_9AGAR|nr:Folic acid synthesis protein [Mycena sanguinolenta]
MSSSVHDTIRVNDLLLTVPLLTGAVWPKPPGQAALQPVLISLAIPHDISSAASSDDLSQTINYSLLCSLLRESFNDKTPPLETLETLTSRIFDVLFSRADLILREARLKVTQSRAPLNCRAVGLEADATSSGSSWTADYVKHFCVDLECSTIIGVNACEREERQTVRVNISIERWDSLAQRHNWVNYRALTRTLHEVNAHFSLASYIAVVTLEHLWVASPDPLQPIPFVTVKAAKPYAIVFANSSEIEIRRTYSDYPEAFARERRVEPAQGLDTAHTAALALGSNLGDRFYNIELALRLLEAPQAVLGLTDETVTVAVIDTSFMYETAPMYVTDQPSFINCACMIETNLAPLKLLQLLKMIETTVGRVPSIRNGPRAVDLDIILYDNAVIDTRQNPRKELDDLEGELVVPHPRLAEREFVLRPLNDMIPDILHPLLHQSISTLLAGLDSTSDAIPMSKVIPFPRWPSPADYVFPHPSVDPVPVTLTYWTYPSGSSPTYRKTGTNSSRQTRVMATLNVTPDSFSDGATHNTLPTALKYAQSAVAAEASILDVGGYSTRPGSAFITAEEEISRVGPCIAAIRSDHPHLPISVDTFRPQVARAAISAGANCINDVYAFTGPRSYPFTTELEDARGCMLEMKKIAREFAVPVVLMHSRDDARANKDYGAYKYAGPGQAVVEGVRIELGAKVDFIVRGRGGVRRWFVIVDPGVGFSKTLDGNLEVLRDATAITGDVYVGVGNRRRNSLTGYPQLIGASRKSFLGTILEQNTGRKTDPKERGWATATIVACAVQQGALVVRVHDTHEMMDVVQVANALWGSAAIKASYAI